MTRSNIQNIKWGDKLSKCHFIIWPKNPLNALFYAGYSLLYQNVTRFCFDKVTFWPQSHTSLIFYPSRQNITQGPLLRNGGKPRFCPPYVSPVSRSWESRTAMPTNKTSIAVFYSKPHQ